MRTNTSSFGQKLMRTFFAAALCITMVPAVAFADDGDAQDVTQPSEATVENAANEQPSTPEASTSGIDDALEEGSVSVPSAEGEGSIHDDAQASDGSTSEATIPAGGIINEDKVLDAVIAQGESTRTFFLAQTLESTKAIPVVSAKLPLDTNKNSGANAGVDLGMSNGSIQEPATDASSEAAEADGESATEEGEGSDESDLGTPISPDSVVVASFVYRGITYAVEPGGESVAIVAADHAKLPSDFIEAQTIVLPSVVSFDGAEQYGVTRIAEGAFASLTAEVAGGTSGIDELAPHDGMSEEATSGFEESEDVPSSAPDGIDAVDEGGASSDGSEANAAVGITAITIPASITNIEDGALAGFDTLRYVIVSADNPNYSMYDGVLYDADQTSLLFIPEGRLGAVRIASSVTDIDPEVFSHCPSVDQVIADADSAAFQLLQGDGIYNEDGKKIEAIASDDVASITTSHIDYSEEAAVGVSDSVDVGDELDIDTSASAVQIAPSSEGSEEALVDERAAYASSGVIQIGQRDSSGNPTGTGGYFTLSRIYEGSSSGYFIASGDGCWADVTWTGGGTTPAAGSIVTVEVLKLYQTGDEATIETAISQSLARWEASESREFIGIRNPDTGSYISMEAIQSGDAFTFSFKMPTAGCTIDSSKISWLDSTFQPVHKERENAVINHFGLNAPSGKVAKWKNASTGRLTAMNGVAAATYSDRGGVLRTPQNAIPYCAGYSFLGWYTQPSGGSVVPQNTTDEGATYYAHWGASSSTTIKIGQRDENGNPTGTGGYLRLSRLFEGSSLGYFIASGTGCWADVTWTGGGTTPAAGSVVSVSVLKLHQSGEEATVETAINQSLERWEATASKEFLGIRNPDTGSYISMETIQGGGAFTFSFKMPASDCKISSAGLEWLTSTFQPVHKDRANAVINRFSLNPPAGKGAYWKNSSTGVLTAAGSTNAATYSEQGSALVTPQNAIPYCSGYTFLGWYTAASGGSPAPYETTDSGATYYAHWGASSSTTIKIGQRDENGNPTGTGGHLRLSRLFEGSSNGYFISSDYGCWADVTWTGGGTTPAVGSIVSVNVLKLYQTGAEATIETAINQSLARWEASETKEFLGIRNPETGSFISMETIQGGGAFSFSFKMPASKCTLSSSELTWLESPFQPVHKNRANAVINRFSLNPPSGKAAKWRNANTGVLTMTTTAATYSDKGAALITPQNAIPYCDGYSFLGWYTAPDGGSSAPYGTTDPGVIYYAHWGNEATKFYYLNMNDNIPGSGKVVSNSNPITYSFAFDDILFKRTGYSITSWTTNANGSGTKYNVGQNYPAMPQGSTTTVYAQWQLDRYDIAYDLSGGSWSSGDAPPAHYDYGNAVVEIPDPVRTGYTFTGWTGTGLSEPTVGLAIDASSNDKLGEHVLGTNVYARSYVATWKANTYQMTFDLAFKDGSASWKDGEEPEEGAYDLIAYDAAVTFPKAPVRSGWIFGSWVRTDDPAGASFSAEQTVDAANFESEQDAVASFEAHWVKNLKVTVPIGSQNVDMGVSVDLVDGEAFEVDRAVADIVNLSDGELKVVSIGEDDSDRTALDERRANAVEAFGGASADAAKLGAVSFVLRPTDDGETGDSSKEEARFELFGSHVMATDTWRLLASSDPVNGTEDSTLHVLYDLAFDYSKIAITDLKINLDVKPISSLVYTVELVDSTEPEYDVDA